MYRLTIEEIEELRQLMKDKLFAVFRKTQSRIENSNELETMVEISQALDKLLDA